MRYSFTFLLFLSALKIFSQNSFQTALGGAQEEFGYNFQKTRDGGTIVAGRTFSFGTGGWECYLARFNSNGDTVWTKTYGNTQYDELQDVDTTSDGGFIAVGHTTTTDFAANLYLIKTDANGVHQWSKEYGNTTGLSDKGYSVTQTSDGGYIIAGSTASYGAGGDDIYVIKTNSTGSILWTRVVGTASTVETGRDIIQTSDGGYVVVGYTDGIGNGFYDIYMIKLSSTGTVLWKKTYGGGSYDIGYTVQQTTDGGLIIGATTNSFGTNSWDAYLLKTDANGTLQWSKTYGKTGEDRAQCASQTSDGGYILCGRSGSGGFGSFDIIAYKTDGNGNLQWTKNYGGAGDDQGWFIREINGNSYVITGYTTSFGAGIKDLILIKTDANGTSGCNETSVAGFTTLTPSTVSGTGGTDVTGGNALTSATAVRNTASVKTTMCSSVACNINSSFNGSSSAVCQGNSVSFSNQSSGATTYNWLINNQSQSSAFNFNYTFNVPGNYQVQLISSAGACSDTAFVNITVNAPTSSVTNARACAQYRWTANNQTYTNSGTYTHNLLNAAGCDSLLTLNLIIDQNPTITVNSATICSGSSVTLNASGALTYQWSPGTGLNTTTGSTVIANPITTSSYLVTGVDINGCSSSAYTTVNVLPSPVVNLGPDRFLCTSLVQLDAGNPGSTYQWSNRQRTQTITLRGSGWYSVTVTGANQCISYDSVKITFVRCTSSLTVAGFMPDQRDLEMMELNTEASYDSQPEIKVYPNPFSSEFYVSVQNSYLNKKYNLYDVYGRMIQSGILRDENQKITMENTAPGFYILKIEGLENYPQRILKY